MNLSKEPEIVEMNWGPFLYLEKVGPFEETTPTAWAEFWDIAQTLSQSLVNSMLTMAFRDPSKSGNDAYIYRVGMTLNSDVSPNEFEGLKLDNLSTQKYAKFSHKGPRSELYKAYDEIFKVLEEKGLKDKEKFTVELFKTSPDDVADDQQETEIYIPI